MALTGSVKLTIVIVNANAQDLLIQTLDSVAANLPHCSSEIIVVDNASSDNSCAAVRERYPGVKLIESSTNVGFGRANNLAVQSSMSDLVLLLNSDTIIDEGSIDHMINAMDNPVVGAVGPMLLNSDGTLQMSFNALPTLPNMILSWAEARKAVPRRLLKAIKKSIFRHVLGKSISIYADWEERKPISFILQSGMYLTCACLLVRREVFNQVGLFDPNFFMYVEDADLCKRISDAGWQLMYASESVVVHLQGGTSGKKYRWSSPFPYLSAFYYMRKHRGRAYCLFAKVAACSIVALRWLIQKAVLNNGSQATLRLLRDLIRSSGRTGYLDY